MQVTYTFNEPDDKSTRHVFEISSDMSTALFEIDNYLREVRKGWKTPSLDDMVDDIQDMVFNSKIHEIE